MVRTTTIAILVSMTGTAIATELPVHLIQVAQASAQNKSIRVFKTETKLEPATEAYSVEVNGQIETRTRTVMRADTRVVQKDISLTDATAYDGSGRKLGEDQMWQRLKPGEAIVAVQSQLPEAALLRVFRPETMILVLSPVKTNAPLVAPGPGIPPKAPPMK